MTAIPTESRIFASRYAREMRRLERLHAGKLAPGTSTWGKAVVALGDRVEAEASPVKRAVIIAKATAYLQGLTIEEATHTMYGFSIASRAAGLCFSTVSAGLHPLEGVDEEGLSIMQQCLTCDRRGAFTVISDLSLAYVSQHAIARLHERAVDLTPSATGGIVAAIGILGYLTRQSPQHSCGEVCLHFGDTLVVGSIKHARQLTVDDISVDGTFYDVRTALPTDEVRNKDMLEQGHIAAHVVASWLTDEAARDPTNNDALARMIPFLPRRDNDYTLRATALAVAKH